MPKPRLTMLDNGLRVLSDCMPGMASVSLGAWVGVGSRYESEDLGGVSHFLEHLLFKGTKTRSAKEITEEIEGIGGNVNAFTSEEHTCYTIKVHHGHLATGMEILSDMLLNSTLRPKEVQRERDVIQEEMNMSRDNPGEYVQELLAGLVWPDHPLGRLIIGTSQTIRSVKRSQIFQYKTQHYTASNMVLVAAGNLSHDTLVGLARKHFGKTPSGKIPSYEKVKPCDKNHTPVAAVYDQKTEQVHMAMAFPGVARGHSDRVAVKVLGILLGGNMSSRLFQEVREKKGFAYDISSSTHHFHDTGSLLIYAGMEARKVLPCLEVISEVLRDVGKGNVRPEELRRAKEYGIGRLTLGLEKTMERMSWLGEWTISTGDIPDARKAIAQIQTVTMRDVRRVARTVLQQEACRLQAIGHGLSEGKMLACLDF